MPRTLGVLLTACLLFAGAIPALAATEITIEGGGWGHGIGMSQYGAKELAEQGLSAEQIVKYFYTGSSIGQVGTGNLAGHAEPLYVGVAQDQTTVTFGAVNGPVSLCIAGVCALTALPEEGPVWSFRANGLNTCQYFKAGAPVGSQGSCNGALTWSNQPNTRVEFPALSRTYARGLVVFRDHPSENTFHLTVRIPLEEYLYGLGEMPSSWHDQALGAQAIAGRTYALWRAWTFQNLDSNPTRMADCACHLYASTKDQKYIGWAKEAEGTNGVWGTKWRNAVIATAGEAIIHPASNNRAIQSYYFSSSGGATENNEDVWGGTPFSYLRSVDDPGASAWSEAFTPQQLAAELDFDKVFSAVITGTNASGSPSGILVRGLDGGALTSKTYTGNQLRTLLGLDSHYIDGFSGFLPTKFDNFVGGDFDGDGRDEAAAFAKSDGTWWVFDHESGTLIGSEWANFASNSGWVTHVAGDFDGDGRDDIASFHSANGTWWVSRSTGSGFSTTLWADFATATGWKTHQAGDFDGDGKDDIASFHPSNGTWWVSRSSGSGFSTSLWADFSTAGGWGAQLVGDFDGNGKDDIANFHPSNGTWWVSKSTGASLTTSLWDDYTTASGWGPQLVGDFTGDGKDDIANFHASNGTWWVSKSSGTVFNPANLWADFTTASGWAPQVVGDFDGDGKDDIANFHKSNGSWWTSRSTGSVFTTSLKGSVSGTGWNGQLALDVDGDGDDDLTNWRQIVQTWAIR